MAAYADEVAEVMIPAVAHERLAEFVDVFVDRGFFDLEAAERIGRAASAAGLGVRLHADQLQRTGAAELGVRLGAASVDHLEQLDADGVGALAASDTVATLLPAPAVVLRDHLPPARALIDAGATVALASDANAGTFGGLRRDAARRRPGRHAARDDRHRSAHRIHVGGASACDAMTRALRPERLPISWRGTRSTRVPSPCASDRSGRPGSGSRGGDRPQRLRRCAAPRAGARRAPCRGARAPGRAAWLSVGVARTSHTPRSPRICWSAPGAGHTTWSSIGDWMPLSTDSGGSSGQSLVVPPAVIAAHHDAGCVPALAYHRPWNASTWSSSARAPPARPRPTTPARGEPASPSSTVRCSADRARSGRACPRRRSCTPRPCITAEATIRGERPRTSATT